MFKLAEFYQSAKEGEAINEKEVLDYLNSFSNIIIWGAGNLGKALGKGLQDQNVRLTAYWDVKYEQITECNGVSVLETFTGEFEKQQTLVIVGVVNGTLSHKWQKSELEKRGYDNVILGMPLYESIVCKMHKGEKLDVKQCTGTSICNFNSCKKYMNILIDECIRDQKKKENLIAVQVLEFILSRKCTLDCKNCGQQVGLIHREFPEKYIVYDVERIKKDIDICMDNMDVVGTFSLIGGEPFTHPNLGEIVQHSLTKKNVAIISVTTNGICNMKEETLNMLVHDRVKVNFSNYTESLSDDLKELFWKNVDKVREKGINCNVSTPIWNEVTDELVEQVDRSASHLTQVRKECVMGPSVSNGVLYACPMTELYSKTERAEIKNDYVDLDNTSDVRAAFEKLLCKPFYQACGYRCGNGKPVQKVLPGEQY